MEVFDKLPSLVDELVDSFLSVPMVGNLNVGFTQYKFWLAIALALTCVLLFLFVKKQSASIAPNGRFVNGMEFVITYTKDNSGKNVVGSTWRKHFPFIASVFFFVLINNLIGMIPGCKPGTVTIGTTAALSLVSFVYFIAVGVRKHGVVGYFKTFSHGLKGPMGVAIWLIELLSTFLRLITLAVRLICNQFAGHIVMGTFAILTSLFATQIITSVTPTTIAMAGASVLWQLILLAIYGVELFVAFVQAFVFALLSAVYVQTAEEEVE